MAADARQPDSEGPLEANAFTADANFCIIESRDSVKNFSQLQLNEINESIKARRNKIFLLMEEVRRLRIQQRLKGDEKTREEEMKEEAFPSAVPFLPPLTEKTVPDYFRFYLTAVAAIIIFGGLLAPILEVRLGVGGTSYVDFINGMHLPEQLAEVDPIVASFCGGSVGVLSALMVVEANNAQAQAKRRCMYCDGTGYLTCGHCAGTGRAVPEGAAANSAQEMCAFCSGTTKVMCTSCLCTGKAFATEHDPRFDPFR